MVTPPAPPSSAPRATRILVVDDEPETREALRRLLEGAIPGARVDTAADGRDALALLDRAPDLILSDYRMPGLDGLSFLRLAAERAPTTPRLMITAHPSVDVAMGAMNEARASGFLLKPLRAAQVLATVREHLDERRAVHAREQAFARSLETLRGRLTELSG